MEQKKYHLYIFGTLTLFILVASLLYFSGFGIFAQTNTTTPYVPCTSIQCADWGDCQSTGTQICEQVEKIPAGCYVSSGTPVLTRPCTLPTCQYTCLAWSPCRTDGTQVCVDTKIADPNCMGGNPPPPRPCTLPRCEYAYTVWGACATDNYKTRNVIGHKNDPCFVDSNYPPITKQQCVYVAEEETTDSSSSGSISEPTCSYQCSTSECKPDGYKIKKCNIPVSGSCKYEETRQSCSYIPPADSGSSTTNSTTTCEVMCSDWGSCAPTTKLQFKKCWPYPSTCAGEIKIISQTCVPKVCSFNYNEWSECAGGLQFRSIAGVAYPLGCVGGEPVLKQSCAETSTDSSTDSSTQNTQDVATESAETQTTAPVDPNFNVDDDWQRENFGTDECSGKICGGLADPDGDGLSNNDELRYGTKPLNRDSDDDGKTDGEEVAGGTDPLKSSAEGDADEITYDNAKESGVVNQDFYAVENVERVELENGGSGLLLSGKGPANSYVTVYVYSGDPIVVTVKTDSNGDWTYTVDKELEDGDHEVYVAVTNNTGAIKAKSEPLPFVKSAQAVSVTRAAEPVDSEAATDGRISFGKIMFILALGFFLVIVAFILLGIIAKKIISKIRLV